MSEVRVDNLPATIICNKALNDIRTYLEEIQRAQQIPSDLMCMVLRDCCSYFEKKRADDYCNAIIHQSAIIDQLTKENEALKKATDLFNMEASDDNTENQT